MNEVQTIAQGYQLTEAQIDTLAKAGVIPQGTPPAVVSVFATMCREHGLSPFKKEIYLVAYNGKYSNIVGIDGLRAKAARTGCLAGKDDVKFNLMPDGSFQTAAQLAAKKEMPFSCTVTVWKIVGGLRCPFTKTVVFAEYCPANRGQKWATMPYNMIEKCAEAAALRSGFADETAGLNIEEESAAIQDATILSSTQPKPVEVPERLVEAYEMTGDALFSFREFKEVIEYWNHFRETELAGEEILVSLFFDAVVNTSKTVAELTDFWDTLGPWQKNQTLVKKLTNHKKELIKNG